jgi:hypothetical protein
LRDPAPHFIGHAHALRTRRLRNTTGTAAHLEFVANLAAADQAKELLRRPTYKVKSSAEVELERSHAVHARFFSDVVGAVQEFNFELFLNLILIKRSVFG